MKQSNSRQLSIDLQSENAEAALELLDGIDHQALVSALAELLLEAVVQDHVDNPGEHHER